MESSNETTFTVAGVSAMGTCDWLTAFRLLFYFKQIGY
jgi:hypothetical protein